MKHFLLSVTTLALMAATTQAQETFSKGDNLVSGQIGIGSGLAVSATYENCVKSGLFATEKGSIGVGGYVGYLHYSDNYTTGGYYGDTYKADWSYNNIILGVRGNLHYEFIDRLDSYAGLMLGYEIVNSSSSIKGGGESISGNADASGFAFTLHLGTRYYFTDNFAAGIEVGYGVAYANVGIAYKF